MRRRGSGRGARRPPQAVRAGAPPRPEDEDQRDDAERDRAVGEVERRPVRQLDEVGDRARAHAVDEVAERAADDQSRWRARAAAASRLRAKNAAARRARRERDQRRRRRSLPVSRLKATPQFWSWTSVRRPGAPGAGRPARSSRARAPWSPGRRRARPRRRHPARAQSRLAAHGAIADATSRAPSCTTMIAIIGLRSRPPKDGRIAAEDAQQRLGDVAQEAEDGVAPARVGDPQADAEGDAAQRRRR